MDKLLIVDDQKSILQMLVRRFSKLNYQVFTAENKDQALAILESKSIDLILLDYMMPNTSGFDLFLNLHDNYKIPVIMMTAHSSINLAIEFMRSGGTDFVEKPIDIDLLQLRIDRAIKQSNRIKKQEAEKKKAEEDLQKSNLELLNKTELLEQKNEELNAFTAVVSHDLKAPIRKVIGFVDLLKNKIDFETADQSTQDYFNFVEEGANSMNQLITDLLDFAHVQNVNKNIQLIDTQSIVTDIVNSINQTSENESQINIGQLPKVKGDHTLISQVFFNLINNAIKYSRNNPKPIVDIAAEKKNNEVIFMIKDNGIGFNQKYVFKLFKMFVRLHSSEFEGSGVGLAHVKRILDRHDGRIWAEGEEGKGASFYFSLPE